MNWHEWITPFAAVQFPYSQELETGKLEVKKDETNLEENGLSDFSFSLFFLFGGKMLNWEQANALHWYNSKWNKISRLKLILLVISFSSYSFPFPFKEKASAAYNTEVF